MAFNPSGDSVVTGGGDNLVKIWNVNSGKEIQTLRGFQKPITDVSISLDNEYLIASSLDNKAVLYRLKTMRSTQSFSGHKDTISACKFSFSKATVLTGSLDRTIKVWDIEKGICTRTVRTFRLVSNEL